jgi:hypothetical protein
MSSIDLTYADFSDWYSKWSLWEILKSPHGIPTEITEADFHKALIEISTIMWSEIDNKKYNPYSVADPRSVTHNQALFAEISRDNTQWQRQWKRYAVSTYKEQTNDKRASRRTIRKDQGHEINGSNQ